MYIWERTCPAHLLSLDYLNQNEFFSSSIHFFCEFHNFFTAEQYSILCMNHIFLTHLLVVLSRRRLSLITYSVLCFLFFLLAVRDLVLSMPLCFQLFRILVGGNLMCQLFCSECDILSIPVRLGIRQSASFLWK